MFEIESLTFRYRAVLGIAVLWASVAHAAVGVSSDLWDITAGVVVSDYSPLDAAFGTPNSYDIRDMFGGEFGEFLPERGRVIFTDGVTPGTVQFVEWNTPTLVRLDGFTLYASGDGPEFGNQREFGNFSLKAKSVGSPIYDLTILSYDTVHPFSLDPAGDPSVSSSYLELTVSLASSVTASEFRAEFTNLGDLSFPGCCGGPRIFELDGFGISGVPELPAKPYVVFAAAAAVLWRRYGTFGRRL